MLIWGKGELLGIYYCGGSDLRHWPAGSGELGRLIRPMTAAVSTIIKTFI